MSDLRPSGGGGAGEKNLGLNSGQEGKVKRHGGGGPALYGRPTANKGKEFRRGRRNQEIGK